MQKKDSIETTIILNLKREFELFKKRDEKSLILTWFTQNDIKEPKLSKTAFHHNLTFIGSEENPKYTGLGIIIYPSKPACSKAFIGNFKEGKRHGVGWRLLNDELFIGKYNLDKKDGAAIIFRIVGNKRIKIFDGRFEKGKHHGNCFIKKEDHIFEGKISKGLYNGYCKISYKNGDYFEGTMIKGTISGTGKIKYNNGDIYEGGFIDNRRCGEGSYIFKREIDESLLNAGDSDDSIHIQKIRDLEKAKEAFEKEHNKPSNLNDVSAGDYIGKSGLYTDWSYSSKRKDIEIN